MLRVKSFKIEDADAASAFMVEHMPLTRDGQPGIQLNMGHVVIFYDDGVFNFNNLVDKFRNLIGKEIEIIELTKHNISRNNSTLKELKPKGYKKSLSDQELLELCESDGDSPEIAKQRVEAIIETEGQNLLHAKTVQHSFKEIELYEKTIAGYASMPQGTFSIQDLNKAAHGTS